MACHINCIPREILAEIMWHFSDLEQMVMRGVCLHWRDIINNMHNDELNRGMSIYSVLKRQYFSVEDPQTSEELVMYYMLANATGDRPLLRFLDPVTLLQVARYGMNALANLIIHGGEDVYRILYEKDMVDEQVIRIVLNLIVNQGPPFAVKRYDFLVSEEIWLTATYEIRFKNSAHDWAIDWHEWLKEEHAKKILNLVKKIEKSAADRGE